MARLYTNGGYSSLASSVTTSQTTLTVATGEGTRFPTPTGGDTFDVTLENAAFTYEVVSCTARTGDVLTIVRAQQGTVGFAFIAGDRVELRLTATAITNFADETLPIPMTAQGTKAGTPAAGFGNFSVRAICGRQMMCLMDPTGIEVPLMPMLAFRKFYDWFPSATTVQGARGMTPTTAVTLSHVAVATTNISTINYGTTYSTSVTAGNSANCRDAVVHAWFGSAAGRGGFDCRFRIGSGLIALAGGQIFAGLASTVAALAAEPSALTDVLGMGKDTADTNWQFMRRTGAGAVVKTDLGVAYAVNQVFDLQVYAPPNSATVYVRILNHAFDGTFTIVLDTSYNTSIPANTTLLGRNFQVRNGVTAAAASAILIHSSLEANF